MATKPKSKKSSKKSPSLIRSAKGRLAFNSKLSKRANYGLALVLILAFVAIGYLIVNLSHAATGYVHVSGNQIYDASGNPIYLSGVDGGGSMTTGQGNSPDQCGKTWSAAPQQAASLKSMGYNTERIAITWANVEPTAPTLNPDGSLTHHWNQQYLAALDGLIQADQQAGIMAILDMHQAEGFSPAFTAESNCGGNGQPAWLYPNLPNTKAGIDQAECEFFSNQKDAQSIPELPQDGMAAAWQMLAARYDSNATVIGADLFNEPHKSCAAGDIAAMYEKVGAGVRAGSPRMMLMFEDNAYSSYMAQGFELTRKPNLTNAVYSWHLYPTCWTGCSMSGQAPMQAHMDRANSWGVPIWIGETDMMGATRTPDLQSSQTADLKSQMDYFKANDVSWTSWGYDNGCCSIVKPGTFTPKPALLAFLQPYMQMPPIGHQGGPSSTPRTPTPTPPTPVSITVSPSADAYVDSNHPNTNYDAADPLWASEWTYHTMMKLPTGQAAPSGYHLTDAKLKLYVTSNSDNSGGLEVHPESNSWSASTLTFNNQPDWNSTVIATSATPTAGAWISIPLPVNSINLSGETDFGIAYNHSYSFTQFDSKQNSGFAPQLVLTFTPN